MPIRHPSLLRPQRLDALDHPYDDRRRRANPLGASQRGQTTGLGASLPGARRGQSRTAEPGPATPHAERFRTQARG